ncbi:MAG TPA: RNA polymerase sigma factor [Gemmatimonadaceae bacterium]|nr:RNA polymerase sigma factor [Gemmatimonadaceae bacterium]
MRLRATPDPDERDVESAASGDTRAFERIYASHSSRIQTLARRILGNALAAEGTQDVFVHAWEQLGKFRGESLFSTWLHRLAVNVLLRQAEIARRITARIAPGFVDELESPATDAATVIDIDTALARLDPGLREVVVLHDMEGYTHEEIAEVLAISISASKMRLHRGRTLLRQWILR